MAIKEEKKETLMTPDEAERLHERCRQLRMWEILCRRSDSDHPIKKKELKERLTEEGFHVNDHSLKDDLKALNVLNGHRIVEKRDDKDMTYYAASPQFDRMDLRILLDALLADTTLTQKELDSLLGKLFAHTGMAWTEYAMAGRSAAGSRVVTGATMKERLAVLDRACTEERQVHFQYFYADENGSHVLQREGEEYNVEAAGLVYSNDRYYLIGWDCSKRRLAHFRVDRMEDIPTIGRKNRRQRALTRDELEDIARQALNMYDGEKRSLTLRLTDIRAIGILRDRFGDDVQIKPSREEENEWTADLLVKESPELWGWLCSKTGLMTVTGAEDARKKYTEWLQTALDEVTKSTDEK